jgi:hypothetical protein
MSETAGTPRITPWRLVFGAPGFDAAQFETVREEADAHGADAPAQLFMLPAAGELLRELAPPEGGREIIAQVSALLFSAYRHWREGRNVYRLDDAALRSLLTAEEWTGSPEFPGAAGYVQLPRNVVWATVSHDAAPEPIDGFFWSAPAASDGGSDRLDLLFALGVRPGRPGLSLFDVSLESTAQLEEWANTAARPDGRDFENVLPGGELQDYMAVTTAAEGLKLAARCLGFIAGSADAWDEHEELGEHVHEAAGG